MFAEGRVRRKSGVRLQKEWRAVSAGKCCRRGGEWKGQCTLLRVKRVLNLNINWWGGGEFVKTTKKGFLIILRVAECQLKRKKQ